MNWVPYPRRPRDFRGLREIFRSEGINKKIILSSLGRIDLIVIAQQGGFPNPFPREGLMMRVCPNSAKTREGMYPCSTKTREVLGNPSPRVKEISRRGEMDFPIHTSRVLVEYGHSLIIKLSTGSGSANPSLRTGKD